MKYVKLLDENNRILAVGEVEIVALAMDISAEIIDSCVESNAAITDEDLGAVRFAYLNNDNVERYLQRYHSVYIAKMMVDHRAA